MALSHVKLPSVDLPQVRWRGFEHHVQCLESLRVIRLEDVNKLDYVTMLGELAQDENLAEHAFGISYIRK